MWQFFCFFSKPKRFDKRGEISIQDVVAQGLKVVDGAATILAMENKMPMLVFGLNEEQSIERAARGEIDGTVVTV